MRKKEDITALPCRTLPGAYSSPRMKCALMEAGMICTSVQGEGTEDLEGEDW